MKELFYNGIQYRKSEEFCQIVRELEGSPYVLLLSNPEKAVIHLRSGWNPKLETHVGYASHYVKFLYCGHVFYVQGSDYYPFTDENYPGRFNFIAYERIGRTRAVQRSYYEKYESLESVRKWMKSPFQRIKGVTPTEMGLRIREQQAASIDSRVRSIGGARETAVLDANPVFLQSETWNDDHKVVHVIAGKGDDSGHWDGFDFDLVTRQICG